jgi:protein gp37
MGEGTKIEWADDTFNPWTGCAKVSQACTNCYAESWARRGGLEALWRGERRRTTPSNWRKPIAWNAAAAASGKPRRVFSASLADVFEDHPALPSWRAEFFDLIEATPALTWLLLTKRPENLARFRPTSWTEWPSNVWLGVTVENQGAFEARVPLLLREPAALRFLSVEPLLGPLRFEAPWPMLGSGLGTVNPLTGDWFPSAPGERTHHGALRRSRIGWVIAGGESGPRARPSHPAWFERIRDACEASGVPFMFKQWGEFAPAPGFEGAGVILGPDGRARSPGEAHDPSTDAAMTRLGKATAGRLLAGRLHDGLPGPAR